MDLITIDGVKYKLTLHAKERMLSRKVSLAELVEALRNTKSKRKQYKDAHETRHLYAGRNGVSCIITITNVIITVYNYKKEYYASKNKNQFNKKRRHLKKEYGNRLKR